MSVISLPDRNESLREAVETVWDFIGEVEDIEMLQYERKKSKVHKALEDYANDEVFQEIKVRRGQSMENQKSIKQAEMETLIASKDELGDDKPDGNFFARTLPRRRMGRAMDELRGTRRVGSSPSRGDGASRFHAI